VSEIVKINSNKSQDTLRIELFLSNICNYKCWYCFPGSNEGTHRWPKLNTIVDNLSHLLDYYKVNLGKKKFHLHVIGGEPTLWSEFEDFVNHFKKNYNCTITMSSNGSRTLRWWEEHGQNFDEVMLSCHHESVDVTHISSVAEILYKKKVWTTAMVLMDPREWDRCVNIVEELKKNNSGWPITAVEIYHATVTYTDDQKKYISKSLKKFPNIFYYLKSKKNEYKNTTVYYNDGKSKKVDVNWLSLNDMNKFYGWSCNIGIDTLYINNDGAVTAACGEFLYNLKYKFNIFESNFKEKFKPILIPTTCYQKSCHCQPEINCRKEKEVIPLVPLLTKEYPLHRYTSL
jgi:molybdenum cofactor biosynthesis enzyme MoaA